MLANRGFKNDKLMRVIILKKGGVFKFRRFYPALTPFGTSFSGMAKTGIISFE